eukprot:TRINITY_DN36420_c0_g1_i3.p1 TRINITY_DN36420_c0_g1~~TRINITY_DN36420_c0_g1_i3.p1  ORF type:complete len:273 (-),score=13.82 TRINITY_DN36420_c0_g1_i3:64-882(-)
MFTTSPVVSGQVEYVAGVRLPSVAPLALYFDAVYSRPQRHDELHVLIFRTHAYWQSTAGANLLMVLSHFLKANVGRGTPIALHQQPEEETWSATRIVDHDAALFMPEDLVKMSFWELYSAGLPLVLPSRFLACSILPYLDGRGRESVDFWKGSSGGMLTHFFDPDAAMLEHRDAFSDVSRRDNDILPPFDARPAADGHRKVFQWSALADFWNWPALSHFGSIPELLQLLWSADLQSISQDMRRYHQDLCKTSRMFYLDAISRLLPEGEISTF